MASELPLWRNDNSIKTSQVETFGVLLAKKKEEDMLWTIFVILLVLWLLGLVSSYTMGGFIHILLVIALVVLLFQFLSGRRTIV